MASLEDPQEAGIDKQKIVREVLRPDAAKENVPGPLPADPGIPFATEEPDDTLWTSLRRHSDEIASIGILLFSAVWLAAGFVWKQPVPLAVGGFLLLVGLLALTHSIQNRKA